jgi:hypothetical protein
MPAERVAGAQRRLKIHRRSHRELPERGERERFARYVGRESAPLHVRRGKAAALYTDTVTDPEAHRVQVVGNEQTYIAPAGRVALDAADVLDDPGEHVARFLVGGRQRPQAQAQIRAHGLCFEEREGRRVFEVMQRRQIHQPARARPEKLRRHVQEQFIAKSLAQ